MLKHLSAAALACALWYAPAAHCEQVLKLGNLLPEKSQIGAGASAFAEEVARRTGGKFRIELCGKVQDFMTGVRAA